METKEIKWCGVPVVIAEFTTGLFEMPPPDEDPEQKPMLLVTQGVAELVEREFKLFRASLEQIIDRWRQEKARLLRSTGTTKKSRQPFNQDLDEQHTRRSNRNN